MSAEHLHGRGASAVEGAELKNLGPGGREMKDQAAEYIVQG